MRVVQKTNNNIEVADNECISGIDFETVLESMCAETRQILTVQKMTLEALIVQESLDDSEKVRIARRAYHQQLRRCSNVEYLLQLKKKEACLRLEYANFVALCSNLIQTIDHLMRRTGVRVTFQTRLHSLAMWIDTWKIHKLLLNLIFNSLQHMQMGDNLHVTLSCQGEAGVVTLRDMSKGILADPFERFEQRVVGTDLGMAISSEIAKLHDGALMFTSPKGKGMIVTVKLPIRPPVTEQHVNLMGYVETDNVMSLIVTELSDVLDDKAFSSVYQD